MVCALLNDVYQENLSRTYFTRSSKRPGRFAGKCGKVVRGEGAFTLARSGSKKHPRNRPPPLLNLKVEAKNIFRHVWVDIFCVVMRGLCQ